MREARRAQEGWWGLGSSGAIYALFAVTAFGFPDAEITFVIPPWFPINIQTGFFALLAIDTLGIIRGWKCVAVQYLLILPVDTICLQGL